MPFCPARFVCEVNVGSPVGYVQLLAARGNVKPGEAVGLELGDSARGEAEGFAI